jgi:hypothetical protein
VVSKLLFDFAKAGVLIQHQYNSSHVDRVVKELFLPDGI